MASTAGINTNRTLWVGDIEPWMDESYLEKVFNKHGRVTNVKLLRNRSTSFASQGYAFVEFATHGDAEAALHQWHILAESLHVQRLSVNWAVYGLGIAPMSDDVSLYVGRLDPSVRDVHLYHHFCTKYGSVVVSKVIVDPNTNISKGYGFVRFRDANEAESALVEMDGSILMSKPIKVRAAVKQNHEGSQNAQNAQMELLEGRQDHSTVAMPPFQAPPPTLGYPTLERALAAKETGLGHVVFVSGVDSSVTELDLMRRLSTYGAVLCVNFVRQGIASVEFYSFEDAEQAVLHLHGQSISSNHVQVWLGNPPTKKTINKEENVEMMSCLDHFQVLLRDPYFVEAFEQEMAVHDKDTLPRLPWLFGDWPELFDGALPASELDMGLKRMRFPHRTVPVIPPEMRICCV